METLKACPFCGYEVDNDPQEPWPADRSGMSWVARCGNPNCGAEIVARTKRLVADAWNRREEPKQ